MIDTLFIFAAGLGTRMRHLTIDRPKSLIQVHGKPILHYVMELALTYPFKRIIINTHYLSNQIHQSIEEFKLNHRSRKLPEIIEIYEPDLLDTGGAIKNVQHILGNQNIFTMNSDIIIRTNVNIFEHMSNDWQPEIMDFLLLSQPYDKAVGYTGNGDFELQEDQQIRRSSHLSSYRYMYAGISIIKSSIVACNMSKKFSLAEYYLSECKVFGTIVPDCQWYHASSPEDIKNITLMYSI